MKVFDTVKKIELEVADTDELVDLMRSGRQVDLYLAEEKTDLDGYITWDVEHWSSIDKNRFICTYTLKDKYLKESTGHNIYDLYAGFFPAKAKKIELS